MRGVSRRAALAALAGLPELALAQQEPPALQRIRARGRLVVAVYQDLPPFSKARRWPTFPVGRSRWPGKAWPAG